MSVSSQAVAARLVTAISPVVCAPGKVTSITTVDGQAGTVVYKALTLVEYTSLKASTTIIITNLVVISINSNTDIETFLTIIITSSIT